MASTKTTNAVISYLLEYGSSPRIDIAKALSLTKASVTLVTNEMLSKGIIIEEGEIFDESNKTIRGRRKILLSINPDYKVTIGVALVGTNITIGITNLKGDIFAKRAITFEFNDIGTLTDKIIEEIELLLKENLIDVKNILALGLVLSKTSSLRLDATTDFTQVADSLRNELDRKVDYNIVIAPIARASMIAQRVFGKIESPNSLIMLSFIEGVDISICINSDVFTGKNNLSGGLSIIEHAIARYENDKDVEKLTDTISICLAVLDIHNVYAFGGIISNFHIVEKINEKLNSHAIIQTPVVTENTLFLAGCGQALFECLTL